MPGVNNRFSRWGWLLVWLAPVLTALAVRGPVPIDETRYLSVAWEMWSHGSFVVPLVNGVPYSHKPPLLFWLMHAGWWLTGVSALWPRLIPALCALGCLYLTRRLSRMLWPDDERTARAVLWVLAGSLAWTIWEQMLLFDMLVAVFVLMTAALLWQLGQRNTVLPWLFVGVAIGLGILAKGPVMLVYTVVPAAVAPVWSATARRAPLRWNAGVLGALLVAAAVALAWAYPAAQLGGPEYANAILWHQTADRMADSFAHARPWWTYLWLFPALLLPWIAVPAAWRHLPRDAGVTPPTRFLLAWLASVLFVMSAISAKQPHYLLPIVPAAALLLARRFSTAGVAMRRCDVAIPGIVLVLLGIGIGLALYREQLHTGMINLPLIVASCATVTVIGALLAWLTPVRWFVSSVAIATAVSVCMLLVAIVAHYGEGFNLRPTAEAISELQRAGAAIADDSGFRGQFTFLGRLEQPLAELSRSELPAWALAHPDGYLIGTEENPLLNVPGTVVHRHRYRRHSLVIWKLDPVTGESPVP